MRQRRKYLSKKHTHDILERRMAMFSQRFGREPVEGEPLIFDHQSETPMSVDPDRWRQEIVDEMARAGVDPAFIYAFGKTGVFAVEGRTDKLKPGQLEAWDAAIAEYDRLLEGPRQ